MTPATPDPAATVILVRDGPVSPEVLMLERHARSEFLPDMYVFPGGRVEDSDAALADRVRGLPAGGAAELVTTVQPEQALSFIVAAIRETYEESGILLASRRGSDELIDAAHADELHQHRLDVQGGATPFRSLIEAEDLLLAADGLAVHGHWITPEMVKRRYDTLFFSALAPAGQRATHDGIESTNHVWTRPEDALHEATQGTRQIIFPTACVLDTLCGFDSAAAVLAESHARKVVPVLPVPTERDGKPSIAIPEDAGYPRTFELLRSRTS